MDIELSGNGVRSLQAIERFHQSGLTKALLVNINKLGYDKPTTVQQHCIPIILKGRDIIACAPTGPGKTLSLAKCRFFVLDEADRLFDLVFEPDVRRLYRYVAPSPKQKHQTLMFGSTFPNYVQQLAREYLNDHIFIAVDFVPGANAVIQQNVFEVKGFEKQDKLLDLLKADLRIHGERGEIYAQKTLVFVERTRIADLLAALLSQIGLRTRSIHCDRTQKQREEALNDFKYGRCPILIATAEAGRQLDIKGLKGVDHVINYDMPQQIGDYVHRIGRTDRVGIPGMATSFYDKSSDGVLAKNLIKVLADAQQIIPEWLQENAADTGVISLNTDKSAGFMDGDAW